MGTASSAAAPERARWPWLAAAPHPRLRGLGAAMPASPRHKGTFSDDGNTLAGDWFHPGGCGYESTMTRVG